MNRKSIGSRVGMAALLLLLTLLLVSLAAAQASPPSSATGNGGLALPLIMKNVPGGFGTVTGVVVDARDGIPIDGASVCLQLGGCVLTDENGNYTISGITPGRRFLTGSAGGYDDLTLDELVIGGTTVVLNFALSPIDLGAGQLRIVVIWDDDPADLDAHLWTPENIFWDDNNDGIQDPEEFRPHIYQAHRGYCEDTGPFSQTNVCLDRDDRDGNGPETITILDASDAGLYYYGVQRFEPACENPSPPPFFIPCPTPFEQSGARVQVYDFSGLRENISIPTSNPDGKFYWFVLTVDYDLFLDEFTIEIIDCYTDEPIPLDDPPVCPP